MGRSQACRCQTVFSSLAKVSGFRAELEMGTKRRGGMGIGMLLILFWNCILWQSLFRSGSDTGAFVSAQVRPSDLSIDCGSAPGSTPYTNPDTTYVFTNDNFITTGEIANVTTNTPVTDDLKTLRYFPASSTPVKNCYVIPVQNDTQYLLRAWFYFGNYVPAPLSGTIGFQLALDATLWKNVSIDTTSADSIVRAEAMVWTAKPSISVCIIRTADTDAPFVNSLEIREIKLPSYIENINASYPSSIFLNMAFRVNFGFQNETFRYPHDRFDRIWPPMDNSGLDWTPIFAPNYPNQVMNFNETAQTTGDFPPSVVMQSAITSPGWLVYSLQFTGPLPTSRFYYRLYFAELEVLSAGSRVMDLLSNFMPLTSGIDVFNLTAYSPYTVLQIGSNDFEMPASDSLILFFNLSRDLSSSYDPIINALEFCIVHDVLPGADPEDVTALTTLKTSLGYTQWVSDPCDPVPWDELACTKDRVTSLNLSSKNLTGSIPSDISNLTALTSLNLSENQLVGSIPSWVGNLPLRILDVSNNNLSGSFPATFFLTISDFRYSGNPLLYCVDVPTSSVSCPQSPPSAPSPPSPPPSRTSRGKTSTGPIVDGVAGAVVVLLVAGGILTWYMCATPDKSVTIRTLPSPMMETALIRARNVHHTPRNKPFTLQAIKVATTNFSTKIGEGGFGPVYLGSVDGRQVAVKVMSRTTRQGSHEFLNEIELLSSVHHKRLVTLLGYCEEGQDPILLYEYMPGGDLQKRLQGPMALQHPLTWIERLHIALDAAQGLEYLHHGCNPAIIHRDVKSSNILLNQNLEAKVADFGLSKLTDGTSNMVTAVKGTFGYLDPLYNRTGLLNEKSDVYSFGIVLMEILCGRPPLVQEGQFNFIVDEVMSAMSKNAVLLAVDPVLREAVIHEQSVWRYLDLASACVSPSGESRPTMQEVVKELCTLAQESRRQTAGGTDSSRDKQNPTPDTLSSIFYASDDPCAR